MTDLSKKALDRVQRELRQLMPACGTANRRVIMCMEEADAAIAALRAQNAGVDEWKARAEKAEADLAAMTAERDKWFEGAGAHHVASMREAQRADQNAARAEKVEAERDAALARGKARADRPTFPILGSVGVRIDYQLVADHAGQARTNHGQSVDGLARRGGLSWCELYAVLHDKPWKKMDPTEAMVACRKMEAHYLRAALSAPPALVSDGQRDLVTDLNRAAAGKSMTLPATDGGEGEPA